MVGMTVEVKETGTGKDKQQMLVITAPLQNPEPSSSGKTLVVCSSHGNQPTTAMINGKPVIIGLNAYIKP